MERASTSIQTTMAAIAELCREARDLEESINELEERGNSAEFSWGGEEGGQTSKYLDDFYAAKEQFLRHLTKKQRKYYDELGLIMVTGSNGGHYIIYCRGGVMLNIWDGKRTNRYCISMKSVSSPFILYLSQKMLIETDEEKFLELANHYKWIKKDEKREVSGWRCIHRGMLGGAIGFVPD